MRTIRKHFTPLSIEDKTVLSAAELAYRYAQLGYTFHFAMREIKKILRSADAETKIAQLRELT